MTESIPTAPNDAIHQTGYLTKKQLRAFLGGIGSTTITDWINKKDFPKPLRISQNMPLWRVADVVRWVESMAKGLRQEARQ